MILAKEGEKKEIILVPAGNHQSVCYDVWDLGFQEGEWKGNPIVQHKIIIGWEINETIPKGIYQGKRYVINKWYTLSLGEKANLRKDLESWRGIPFTEEELKGVDIETLVGMNGLLNIGHKSTNGKAFAKVLGISPLPKGMPNLLPENKRTIPEWVKNFQDQQVSEPVEDEIMAIDGKDHEEVSF